MIVIGAGIAGCCIARMLAERNETVQIYEQSAGIGGVLKTLPNVTIDTTDHAAVAWLMGQVPLMALPQGHLAPREGYIWLCSRLLDHPRISLMKHIRVVDVLSARRFASHLVSTASPDALVGMRYGALQWHEGRPVRNPMMLSVHAQYSRLLSNEGVMWCGSLASFELLSIPQIIRQAMAITDAICQPSQSQNQKMRTVAPLR